MEEFNTKLQRLWILGGSCRRDHPFSHTRLSPSCPAGRGCRLGTFIATSILARALSDSFLVAGLLWGFGEPIRDFIEKASGPDVHVVYHSAVRRVLSGAIPMTKRTKLCCSDRRRRICSAAAWQRGASSISAVWHPCKMCIWQRYPHGAAIADRVLAIALPNHSNPAPVRCSRCSGNSRDRSVITQGSSRGGGKDPASCTSGDIGGLSSQELMDQIMSAPLVRCDDIPWEMLGLSMAGWNALISAGLVLLVWHRCLAQQLNRTAGPIPHPNTENRSNFRANGSEGTCGRYCATPRRLAGAAVCEATCPLVATIWSPCASYTGCKPQLRFASWSPRPPRAVQRGRMSDHHGLRNTGSLNSSLRNKLKRVKATRFLGFT